MIVKNEIEFIEKYQKDASNYKGNAEILYIPENSNELKDSLRECFDKKMPVTIYGGGTGLGGGAVADYGALISTEKLNKILKIDQENYKVTVEPGVLLKNLQEELEQINFFYPPNPTENNSFIGGNIATNASGSRTFKYGATRNYVDNLKLYLIDGDLINLSRNSNFSDTKIVTENGKIFKLPDVSYQMPEVKQIG